MEIMNRFWGVVIDVWQQGLFGVDVGRIIIAVFVFSLFLLIRKLFASQVINRLAVITKRTKTLLDDEVLEMLEKPIAFIPVVLGLFIATEYLALPGVYAMMAERLIRSLIVFVIFWTLIKLIGPMSFLLRGLEKVFTSAMIEWLIKAIKVV